MGFFLEIDHDPNLIKTDSIIIRDAVRAIIPAQGKILMIYSPVNGDYKFPGGGIMTGETPIHALAREVLEESGYQRMQVLRKVGEILEHRKPQKTDIDLYRMRSIYYLCQINKDEVQYPLKLDDYERDLGFKPVWIEYHTALGTNQAVLTRNPENIPRWTRRDTIVLEHYIPELLPDLL